MAGEIDVSERLAAKLKAAGIGNIIQLAQVTPALGAGIDVEDIDEINELFLKAGIQRTLVPIQIAAPPAAEADSQPAAALPVFELKVRSMIIEADGTASLLLEARTKNLMPWMNPGKGEQR